MCDICDGKISLAQARAEFFERIEQHGWATTAVEASRRSPGWAYSAGLIINADLPELIVVGLPPHVGTKLVNDFALLAKSGELGGHGDTIDHQGLEVRLANVHESQWNGDWFLGSLDHQSVSARTVERRGVQIFWPDRAGRFPDDPDFCAHCRPKQPRLDIERVAREFAPATTRRPGAIEPRPRRRRRRRP